jgi:fibronectin type 3 domain-containing protein
MVAEEKGPENLSAVAKGTRVYLTWNEMPKSDSRITYNIYRATSPDDDFMLVNRDDIKTNSFIDDRNSSILPLTGGTLYYYMAAAVISGRETAGSNIVQAMPQNILEPPSGITIISHASGATLKWSDPEEDTVYKASGYNIYRATEGSMVRINTDPVKETVYDDSGLTNGVKYYYSLQSVDFRGNTSDMSFPPDSVVPFDLISAPKNVKYHGTLRRTQELSGFPDIIFTAVPYRVFFRINL